MVDRQQSVHSCDKIQDDGFWGMVSCSFWWLEYEALVWTWADKEMRRIVTEKVESGQVISLEFDNR